VEAEIFDAFKAILMQHGHLPAGFQLGHVAGQGAHVRGVEFKQLELVMPAQQALADEGRAGYTLVLLPWLKARTMSTYAASAGVRGGLRATRRKMPSEASALVLA
jgi:hypothetical protein